MDYERFFAGLDPRLEMARVLDRELDRNLAHRFNVLDYLRDNELGLSRIIADLLDPEASHGQGTLFLQTLLASLKSLKETPHWPDIDRSHISVDVERVITADRRIDISVEIVDADGETCCLAIENKPYAGDRKNQVKHNLKYLKKKYGERFLLIYSSPTGGGPSEWSIRKTELHEWKDRFAIMPYYGGQEDQEDEFKAFRIPYSLADWVGECRKNCEVDRLRWFLRDVAIFCQRTFGGQAMITDSERKAASDFVLSNPGNLETALALVESWPKVKASVCGEFLKALCFRIETAVKASEKLKEFADDTRVDYEYKDKSYGASVWLYRECWAQYTVGEQLNRRTSIQMQNQSAGPNGWYICVSSPKSADKMANGEKERRERLEKALKNKLDRGRSSPWCPWWAEVDEDNRNWNSRIPDLHRECKEQPGEITKYFVDKFTEIAEKAIPVINKIEG